MSLEDAIETIIGRFGKYQSWVLFLILLGRYPTEFQLTNVVFILPSVNYVCKDDNAYNLTNHCPCRNPEYDQSTIVSSVTSEWNLICDRTSLASLSQSMLQVGILAGSLVYGYVSDRYGRKISTINAFFFTALFGVLAAVSPQLWMFIVCRFFIGMSLGGTMLCAYILLIEISGKSFRPYVVGLEGISYVTGYFAQPIIAYYLREWRYLILVTSAPWLLVVAYYWLLPESPRWLITVGKKKQAIDLLTYIAKKNNRPTENIERIVSELDSIESNNEQRGTYLDLFKTPKIRKYTIVNVLVWMCCAHTFFGINQYIGRLDGNLYLNVMLSAVVLAPGLVLVVLSSLYLKRKVSIIVSFCTAAVPLLIFIFLPKDMPTATLAFAIIGQLGAYTSFILTYLYSCELFPTVVRNSAMGLASVFARFASFVAPFVVNIGIEWVSILIFSGLAFCAAFLCLFLPETKDIVLFNTIDQVEQPKERKTNDNKTAYLKQ
ncbi:organic cation transporter protein-like [Pectinophora gossypiella]|uniref:organic cation transporter protein-like n=1 Tax=Pectinophora gossypiella TaxID=13191 RepID=UPI00214E23BA|nr:organic cation transporter protein-like [Pectinophora gossypiella]